MLEVLFFFFSQDYFHLNCADFLIRPIPYRTARSEIWDEIILALLQLLCLLEVRKVAFHTAWTYYIRRLPFRACGGLPITCSSSFSRFCNLGYLPDRQQLSPFEVCPTIFVFHLLRERLGNPRFYGPVYELCRLPADKMVVSLC